MGTLMSQNPREYCAISTDAITNFVKECNEIARATSTSRELVFEAAKILEMKRRNDLYVWNGDIFDEQMAGFGELIIDLSATLDKIGIAYHEAHLNE